MPYTIQESLQYQVPCIVTDIGGCTELIKDGVNGYVVPLDMNFDIRKILNIPKCEEYENHALEKWLDYLKYDKKVTKKDIDRIINEKKEEEKTMYVKVRALEKFEKVRDAERNIIPKVGDIWETTKERGEYLAGLGYVEIIKVTPQKVIESAKDDKEFINPIKEELKEVKVEVKKPVKKPTKKGK